jgi:pyrimidine-nucleoside phosphorylase
MLIAGGIAKNNSEAEKMLRQSIDSGAALEKFRRMVINQGGDISVIDDISCLPQARYILPVISQSAGYVSSIFTEGIGRAAVAAGAGRFAKDDIIDYAAGIIINKKVGDIVSENEPLAFIHTGDLEKAKTAASVVMSAYTLSDKPLVLCPPAVYAVVDENGVHTCV